MRPVNTDCRSHEYRQQRTGVSFQSCRGVELRPSSPSFRSTVILLPPSTPASTTYSAARQRPFDIRRGSLSGGHRNLEENRSGRTKAAENPWYNAYRELV